MENKKTLATEYPEIAKEWHPTKNGDVTPNDVTPKSGKKVWWLGSCGHEWDAVVNHRTNGQNCPICSNHRLLPGFNDLATKFPSLVKEWHPTKNGFLKPSDVFPKSTKKVWWLGKCGHEWQATISGRTANGNGCPICGGKQIVSGINDLLTANPSLAKEWDYEKNIGLLPTTISPNTHKKVWWICSKCGNNWFADIHHRNAGVGCPICANEKRQSTYHNNTRNAGLSLADMNPVIAKEWNYEKNGNLLPTHIHPNSNLRVWWKCKKGHEWQAVISSRNNGSGCPYCDSERHTSFPEQTIMFYLLKFYNIKNRYNEFGKELDIYIPSLNIGIEYDGRYYHNSEKSIQRDIAKNLYFAEKGVRLLRVKESNRNSINSDVISYKHDSKYTELPWVINTIGTIIGITGPIDVNIERDRFDIYEQYIRIEKENSLAFLFPNLATEWHPTKNKALSPLHVTPGSQKRVWWLGKCGHEWQSIISSRTISKAGCPVCSGSLIVSGINDLSTKNPSLVKEWDYEKNKGLSPTAISPNSHKKVWWICSVCGNKWQATVKNRNNGTGCPFCRRQKIKGNKN